MTDEKKQELTDADRAALVEEMAAARDAEEQAKAVLSKAKETIKPQEAAKKAATEAYQAARKAVQERMSPGDKWSSGKHTVTMTQPKQKFENRLDTDALIEYIRQASPDLIAHYTRTVDVTPAASIRLTDAKD